MKVYAELQRATLPIPYGPFLPDGRPCLRPRLPPEIRSGAIQSLEITGVYTETYYRIDVRLQIPHEPAVIDLVLHHRDLTIPYQDLPAVRDATWKLLFRITDAVDYAVGCSAGLPTRYPKIPRTAERCLFQPEGVWAIRHEHLTASDLCLSARVHRWPRWLTQRTQPLLERFPRLEDMIATIDYQPRAQKHDKAPGLDT